MVPVAWDGCPSWCCGCGPGPACQYCALRTSFSTHQRELDDDVELCGKPGELALLGVDGLLLGSTIALRAVTSELAAMRAKVSLVSRTRGLMAAGLPAREWREAGSESLLNSMR